MNKKQIILPIAALTLLILIGSYFFLKSPTDEAITATGMVEITQANLTPKVSGYLVERNFKEGDRVEKGDILAKLDKTDLSLQYLQTVAAQQSAQAKLNDLLAGARGAEIVSFDAAMTAAGENRNKAASDYARFEKLHQSGAISAQSLDNYRVALASAEGNYKQAEAAYRLALEGNRTDTIESQKYLVEQSRAATEAAHSLLKDTEVKSPISGKVLSKNYEVGEFIAAGSPIATLGDLSDCWVKIYIPSPLLGKIFINQEAEIRIDSYPDKVFQGKIKEIATEAEFTPRQTITKNERANLVFAVKITMDNSEGIFKPGMPAEIRIP